MTAGDLKRSWVQSIQPGLNQNEGGGYSESSGIFFCNPECPESLFCSFHIV